MFVISALVFASDKPDALATNHANRTSWLRAAILGANDGLLSVASLFVGVSSTLRTLAAIAHRDGRNRGRDDVDGSG